MSHRVDLILFILAVIAVALFEIWLFNNKKIAIRFYLLYQATYRPKWAVWLWSFNSYVLFSRVFYVLLLCAATSFLLDLLLIPPKWVLYVILIFAVLPPVLVLIKGLKEKKQNEVADERLVEEEYSKMIQKWLDKEHRSTKEPFLMRVFNSKRHPAAKRLLIGTLMAINITFMVIIVIAVLR
jgi:hypothetical protein